MKAKRCEAQPKVTLTAPEFHTLVVIRLLILFWCVKPLNRIYISHEKHQLNCKLCADPTFKKGFFLIMLYLIMPVTVKQGTTGAGNPGTQKMNYRGNFTHFFKETPQLNLIWHWLIKISECDFWRTVAAIYTRLSIPFVTSLLTIITYFSTRILNCASIF